MHIIYQNCKPTGEYFKILITERLKTKHVTKVPRMVLPEYQVFVFVTDLKSKMAERMSSIFSAGYSVSCTIFHGGH
jgi:hypothetical protein